MKLTKQDVHKWIFVYEDGLPKETGIYNAIRHGQLIRLAYNTINPHLNVMWENVTQWEKAIKDVYVLTEDEIEKFSISLLDAMVDGGICKGNLDFSSERVFYKFLTSLTS